MGKNLKGKDIGAGYSQRPDGRYQKSFRYEGKQIVVYGTSLKECKAAYEERRRKLEQGVYAKHITLDAYFAEWKLNINTIGRTKGSSLLTYETLYKHISAEFGGMRIDKIKPLQVKAFQRDLAEKYKPRTVNSILGLMHNILSSAVEDELIVRNPVTAKQLQIDDGGSGARALTREELQIFMQYAAGAYYYNAIRLMFATGMRSGEMRGLMWSDYDAKNGVLHIRRTASVSADNKLAMNTPKSKNGLRDIPVNAEIREILDNQRQQARMLSGKVAEIVGYIFKSFNGKVISRDSLRNEFNAICRRINADGIAFERITPHACRHTFITMCIHAGMNEYVLKDIVGHAHSAKVTTEIYLDRDAAVMQETMNRVKII